MSSEGGNIFIFFQKDQMDVVKKKKTHTGEK